MIKKADILIIISVLLVATAVFFSTFFNRFSSNGDVLNIYIDGKINYTYELPLYKKEVIEIKNDYGYNKIIVNGSSVLLLDSDCKGKDCVRTGEIKKSGDFIICAPHRLIVRIENKKAVDLDAVTY